MKPRLIQPSPPDDSVIIAALKQAGYQVKHDGSAALYDKMLQQFGGVAELKILQDPAILRLLSDAQIRKGRIFTVAELWKIAQPDQHSPHFEAYVQDLVLRQILIRGYQLTCPNCDLTEWYLPQEANEVVDCRGCLARFQLPLRVDFSFKPNTLIIKGLNNGALTWLLTLHWFFRKKDTFQWGAGYVMKKGGQSTNLDLVIMQAGRLILIECKDRLPPLEVLGEQFTRLKQVAEDVGGVLLLATLQEDVPEMDWSLTILRRRDLLGD
jgi:hypothetical protein